MHFFRSSARPSKREVVLTVLTAEVTALHASRIVVLPPTGNIELLEIAAEDDEVVLAMHWRQSCKLALCTIYSTSFYCDFRAFWKHANSGL